MEQMMGKPNYHSITSIVPLNGSIADTVVSIAEELNKQGYKVISHSVASLHHNPSDTVISVLGKLKQSN